MLIGNLPEDTSISDDGFIPYSEDGQRLHKMSIKNFNGGGAGLKYWKETENTLYRVQHNEGQWLFDDFFKVPGAAEIVVGCTYWDLEEGGVDRDLTTPILVGHVDPETHEVYYTEEDGPEVAFLQGRVKRYYIFRRISNKVVMGGYCMWKFWSLDDAHGGRLPEDSTPSQSDILATTRWCQNLPGWLLASTDKDALTYQLIQIDPWEYSDMSATVQERIDNGFFTWSHEEEQLISTIAPIQTPITHTASGAVFYVNGMPDPEIFENLLVKRGIEQGVTWYSNVTADLYLSYVNDNDEIIYWYNGSYNCPSHASDHDYYRTSTTVSSLDSRSNWLTDNSNMLGCDEELNGRKKIRCIDSRFVKLTHTVSPSDYMSPELAYLGCCYNVSGFAYTDPGKDALTYLFTKGKIQYPQGYFTGIATGFATRGKVLYAGVCTDDYDTPQVDLANFSIDSDGNIVAHSISVADLITSNGNPVIGNIVPTLMAGTEIANVYPVGESEPIKLYAPSGGGGGGTVTVTPTRIWRNPKSGYRAQVSSLTMDYAPGGYDILIIDLRDEYSDAVRSFKHYIYTACLDYLDFGASDAVGSTSSNYVSFIGGIQANTKTYSLSYGGNAFIYQIIGIKLTVV